MKTLKTLILFFSLLLTSLSFSSTPNKNNAGYADEQAHMDVVMPDRLADLQDEEQAEIAATQAQPTYEEYTLISLSRLDEGAMSNADGMIAIMDISMTALGNEIVSIQFRQREDHPNTLELVLVGPPEEREVLIERSHALLDDFLELLHGAYPEETHNYEIAQLEEE